MIVYARWDYVDRHVHSSHAFWRCYPDGRDARAPHGNYYFPVFDPKLPQPIYAGAADLRNIQRPRWLGTPVTETSIRAVPGTRGLYTAIAAGHHNPGIGALILIDLSKPDDYRHNQVARVTQNPYCLDGDQPSPSCLWATPWPLSRDFYLASHLDRLYVLDRFGNRELIHPMKRSMELSAAKNPWLKHVNAGRAKNGQAPLERLDLHEFDGNLIRWRPVWPTPLRPRPVPPVIPTQTYQSADRYESPGHKPATLAVMNVYDTDVPLPPGTKVKWLRLVQILATSSGQYKGVGPGNQGATVSRLPLGVVPPDYEKQIVPIFERTCLACHAKQGKGPQKVADFQLGGLHEKKGGRNRPAWVRWGWTANSGRGFARTTPGYCGALNSPLWNHIQSRRQAFTPDDLKRLAWWMDLSCPLQGGYNGYYQEVNGVRWPIHQDIDPRNPLGVERPEDLRRAGDGGSVGSEG
jgi:hypothetical protein